MEIAVLIKRVPDPEAAVKVSGGALEIENRYMMGIFDEIALEQALRMRDKLGGRVWALSAGTAAVVEILRKAVSMGADKAVRIEVDPAAGKREIASALAQAVREIGAGIVLCGKQSGDEEAGFTGPAVATFLGMPCVCAARSLEFDAGGGKGRREAQGGTETFEVRWPAVVSASRGMAEPRIPMMAGVMKAMKAQIEVRAHTPGDGAGADAGEISWEPASSGRKVKMIEGEPAQAAAELVRLLKERNAV